MGTGYTRQSAGEILTGEIAEAADFNNEFNALEHAFNATTGHSHDGTSGEGPQISLASSVTGTLPVANGGTGATTLTDGGVLLGSGTGAVTAMSVLSNGQIIVGDGTTDPVALSAFTAYNGYLKHELGGLEADVSAYNGLVKVSGGSTSAVTAPTGTIVGTSDSQTLTNKTITAADNTLTIASTDLSDSASITLNTATQTLTNKTIVAANNTITMASTDLSDTASITLNAAVQTLTNKTISAANNTITIASTDLSDTAALTYNADTDASVLGFVIDEDNMVSDSNTKVPTQQSVKAYVDSSVSGANLVNDTSPQLGGDLDLNGNSILFPSTVSIADTKDEDDMVSNSATSLATQQSIKAYVDTVASGKVSTTTTITAGTGLTGGGDLSTNRSVAADIASQVEAEAGTSSTKLMTPERVAQAIPQFSTGVWEEVLATTSIASQAFYDVTNLGAYNELVFIVYGTTDTDTTKAEFRVSDDNGTTFETTGYYNTKNTPTYLAQFGGGLFNTGNTWYEHFLFTRLGNLFIYNGSSQIIFDNGNDVDAVRLVLTAGASTFGAGSTIEVWGRK